MTVRPISARAAAAALALAGAGYLAILAAVATGTLWLLLAGAALSYLDDVPVVGRPIEQALQRIQLGLPVRSAVRLLLVVAASVTHGHPSRASVLLLATGCAIVLSVRSSYDVLRARAVQADAGLVRWLNIDDAGLVPPTPDPSRPAAAMVLRYLDAVMVLGVALSWSSSRLVPLAVATAVVLLLGAAVLAEPVAALRRRRSEPTVDQRNQLLYEALSRRRPQVVVYFSSPAQSTYALNVWLEVIDRLSAETVIFLGESWHLDSMDPTRRPVVVVPTAELLRRFQLPSLRVALYPTSVTNNDAMLALPGLRHILIGHGDSDKSVTASPLHRAFDETWVAGPAARDRYLRSDSGVTEDQIRIVGRPQLAGIEVPQQPATEPFTVLYAPTWEGNFDSSDYSSVLSMGHGLLSELLNGQWPVRVLFRPHPATGQRSPAVRRARRELADMVRDAGPPHAIASGMTLIEAFNESDVLIADISSVVIDYLASRKPYLVTNPRGIDEHEQHAELLSTTGGNMIPANLSGFAELLADAFTSDRLRERRSELAGYFLGDPQPDPIARFDRAVTDAVGAQQVRLTPLVSGRQT